jgi:fumarate hydratase class II
VRGIEVNAGRARELLERNLSLGTALAPHVGYDRAAALAKQALEEDKTVREVARAEGVLDEDRLDEVMDARAMTEPGIPGGS